MLDKHAIGTPLRRLIFLSVEVDPTRDLEMLSLTPFLIELSLIHSNERLDIRVAYINFLP